MVLKKETKRLGVFVFYDKDGIVDDYVLYLLNSLKEATNDIMIVSNSNLSHKEKEKFLKFTKKITVRENIGLDAGAFKAIYDEYYEYMKTFDELLLLNDTFFGPFVPFKTICESMSKKDIDFWGLCANYDSPDGFGYLPDKMIHSHIQTFFIAFRSSVLMSDAFCSYWKNYNINKMKKFNDVVTKHEIVFTHYLEQAGFKWDVYTNLEKYHSNTIEENFNVYAYASYDLIKNCNCPFIKKKNFSFPKKDVLFLSDGEDMKKSLAYIEEKNLYNTNFIWQNILRLYNTEDIYYSLNLNYIVKEEKESSKSYVILFLLEEEKYVRYYKEFLKNTKIENIVVITNNKNIKKTLEEENIMVTNKKDFDSQKYDCIGIVKDTYLNSQRIPIVYENHFNNTLVNGMNSNEYIYGILNIFNKNKYIGMLVLPESYHSDYFGQITDKNNKINCNLNFCWIKKELFDWKALEDKYFIRTLLETLKLKQYIVGKIYNQDKVQNTLLNQEYILQKTYQMLGNGNGYLNSLSILLYFHSHAKKVFIHHTIKLRIYNFIKKIYYKLFK